MFYSIGIAAAAPLSAFLRVPLSWYHSQTFAFFPDESRSSIRRFYSHPTEQHVMRQFCGFCGTPLSYWSEEPRSEADYIQLTLGSLLTQDLRDLEDMGLLPDDSDNENNTEEMDLAPTAPVTTGPSAPLLGREFSGLPWFDSLVRGSQLGNMRTSRGARESRDGHVRVEWEITEWTGDGGGEGIDDESESSSSGKRKLGDTDHDDAQTAARGNTN
ncbi:uncharacterized protein PG998_005755 [Apiospora kogelbergensis]|uniref:uncharacterized protein n=1 Tax=Apiospora kogelbergensis TaxID=1337665 RepID=UPI00312DF2AE